MEKPFKAGEALGEDFVKQGWLEATCLNSTKQHQEDVLSLAQNTYPNETEEEQQTVAAGVMHAWSQHKNWRHESKQGR